VAKAARSQGRAAFACSLTDKFHTSKLLSMYCPSCLAQFPSDLAGSLLEQALQTLGIAKSRLSDLTDEEKKRLDDAVWRLVTAADVGDNPCGD